MADYRAPKSGLAHEAQLKMLSKWDNGAALNAMKWVSQSTNFPLPDGFDGDMGQTHEYLKDGFVLIQLVHWCKNGSVAQKLLNKKPKMSFQQMELIGIFLDTLKKNKLVKDTELFQTVDLYESTNMPSVITTIESLGRTMQTEGRGFGKAESHGEKKQWTEEQLKAGQGIIGLQMGTNQGANQSGLNIGKTRAIMD